MWIGPAGSWWFWGHCVLCSCESRGCVLGGRPLSIHSSVELFFTQQWLHNSASFNFSPANCATFCALKFLKSLFISNEWQWTVRHETWTWAIEFELIDWTRAERYVNGDWLQRLQKVICVEKKRSSSSDWLADQTSILWNVTSGTVQGWLVHFHNCCSAESALERCSLRCVSPLRLLEGAKDSIIGREASHICECYLSAPVSECAAPKVELRLFCSTWKAAFQISRDKEVFRADTSAALMD